MSLPQKAIIDRLVGSRHINGIPSAHSRNLVTQELHILCGAQPLSCAAIRTPKCIDRKRASA